MNGLFFITERGGSIGNYRSHDEGNMLETEKETHVHHSLRKKPPYVDSLSCGYVDMVITVSRHKRLLG